MGNKMTLDSIFPKGKQPFTGLVIYRFGRWTFTPPQQWGTEVKRTVSETYFQMNLKFGLIPKGVTKSVPKIRGKAGEYLGRDINGVYSVISEKQFRELFPIKNQNPPHNPCTNKELQNPNYLTDIVQQQKKQASNMVPATSYKITGKKKFAAGKFQGIGKTTGPTGIYNK